MAIAGAEPRPPRRPAPARNRRAHRRPRHQPATAAMRGYAVREMAVAADGDVDIEALKAAVGPPRLGIMFANPSTRGLFEQAFAIAE